MQDYTPVYGDHCLYIHPRYTTREDISDFSDVVNRRTIIQKSIVTIAILFGQFVEDNRVLTEGEDWDLSFRGKI